MLTAESRSSIDPLCDELRRTEFRRLDEQSLAYLDYTGCGLYAERQLRQHMELLGQHVFGNPHSESAPSRASTAVLGEARASVLRFLDADPSEYLVCFTGNASAAIKLVAESYPFGRDTSLLLSVDNHNSINGVREYARRAGASIEYVGLDDDLRLRGAETALRRRVRAGRLFAFPAQSNFSGVKHSLELIHLARDHGATTLLDAAAYLPTNRLSLREYPADFVALSFYKIFGYPTGLGALVARRAAMQQLRRPWFAGGTVDYASVQHGTHRLRATSDAFEDGTPNYLGIAALAGGFEFLEQVGWPRISSHVERLTASLLDGLQALRRDDGHPLVEIYGPRDMHCRGATIAFNVLDADRRPVPYWVVEEEARKNGIALRGGCFCNPGASEAAFRFSPVATSRCFAEAEASGFSIPKFAACLGSGVAVGAVRASLGLANNDRDIGRALELIATFG